MLAGGLTLVAVRASVATVVRVHGDGMAPTIVDGDAVLLMRHGTSLQLGDVVVYDPTPHAAASEESSPGAAPDHGRGSPDGPASGVPRASEPLRNASLGAEHESVDPEDSKDSTPGDLTDGTASAAPHPREHELARGGVFMRTVQDVEHGVRMAVVDTEELEGTWAKVQRRSGVGRPPPRGFRIGRVLARPGDHVTFRVPGVPLGLEINGAVLVHVPEDPVRVQLTGDDAPRMRASTREALVPIEGAHDDGNTAHASALSSPWSILPGLGHAPGSSSRFLSDETWPGMELPDDATPIEMVAPGYLVLADHRDDGACCDSRVLGFLPPSALRGEVIARIAGDARKAPRSRGSDGATPPRRGPAWLR